MANWRIYDVSAAAYHTLVDFEIKKKIRGLNVVKGALIYNISLADNTLVEIYDTASAKVFTGFTKKVTKPSDTTLNKYDITERAIELADYLCESAGSYEYTYTSDSVNTIIDDILTGTGWTRGSSDTTVLDYVSLTYAKKLSALFYILREQRSHEVWFNNATKTVYFGAYRTDRSASNISYIRKEDKSVALKHNVDKVIVLGPTTSISGEAGVAGKVVAFQYKEAATSSECGRIATMLLSELGSSKVSEKVYLEPTITYEEGDKIKVDGTVYVVFSVSIKMTGTVLLAGSTEETILEAFDGKLREVSGSVVVGTNSVSSYDGGEQNVGSTVFAKYRVQIDDVSLVNTFKLVGKLGKWKKSLSTGLEGTGLGVDSDPTGVSINDDTGVSWMADTQNYSTTVSTLHFSNSYSFSVGATGYMLAACTAVFTFNPIADTDVDCYLDFSLDGSTWFTSCRSNRLIGIAGKKMSVSMTGFAPGSSSLTSLYWRLRVTQNGVGDGRVEGWYMTGYFYANHNHSITDPNHNHSTTETDHGHPETNSLTEVDNFPADVVIKVNSATVGTWNAATNGQVVTVADIKAQLITGLNEITVESTKAISIYLGGEVEMVLV